MTLDDLGPRICILGRSNSGKSTLAAAIGRARLIPPIHLDQLHHRPNSDWEPRPPEEFLALHDEALKGERWIMEGNYSHVLPRRLARATGVILLDTTTAVSLFRYFRRTLLERDRDGGLEGGKDSLKWEMIRYVAFTSRANRRRYDAIYDDIALPKIRLSGTEEIAAFYRSEGLGGDRR